MHTFLTRALRNAKTKSMVDNKWRDIASAIYNLAKRTPFSTKKIKKKWFDIKSRAKRDVALFKKASHAGKTPKSIPKPTILLKFQTFLEAYALKGNLAPIFAILVTKQGKFTSSLSNSTKKFKSV